jgi:hypothetical protein
MCTGKRATITQTATYRLLLSLAPACVISGAPVLSLAARKDYSLANSAAPGGRYSRRSARPGDLSYIRFSSTLLPSNEQSANTRDSSLPKFSLSFDADNQRAQYSGLPSAFAGSGERSPP